MSRKHNSKHKLDKALHDVSTSKPNSPSAESNSDNSLCVHECCDREKKSTKWWRSPEVWTAIGTMMLAVFGIPSFVFLYLQLKESHEAMIEDQRAWISVPFPTNFPLTGTFIPAGTQITNSGKTLARDVQGDIIATVLNKGDEPSIGDFSVGHPHNRMYVGSVFPNAPVPTAIKVSRYGPSGPEPIIPDEGLRQDIANGNRCIVFYGRITYYDVFGNQHWTQFCVSTSTGQDLKKCISYNDADNNVK